MLQVQGKTKSRGSGRKHHIHTERKGRSVKRKKHILWKTEERSFVFKHGTIPEKSEICCLPAQAKSEICCLPAQAKSENRFFIVIFVVTELLFT